MNYSSLLSLLILVSPLAALAQYTVNPTWPAPSTSSIGNVYLQPNENYTVFLFDKVHIPEPYKSSMFIGTQYFYNNAFTANWNLTGTAPSQPGEYTINWGARYYSTSSLYASPTSNNSFVIKVLNQFENWRLVNFSTLELTGLYADSADYDADGTPNLLEYALGTDPKTNELNSVSVTLNGTGYLQISYTKIIDPALEYQVQASLDLVNWTTISTELGNGAIHRETRTIQDVLPISFFDKRFLRLNVIRR